MNINLIRQHALNIFGKRTGRKIIVLESDDWGNERLLNKQIYENARGGHIINKESPYWKFDALESNDDLTSLFDLLLSFKNAKGEHPVLTANFITGNPDFERIKTSGFSDYYYNPFFMSFQKYDNHNRVESLYKDGIAEKVFHPQLHGRDHIDTDRWLNALRMEDPVAVKSFELGFAHCSQTSGYSKRESISAAFDYNAGYDVKSFEKIILDGAAIFRDYFGYESKSFIAPAYIWPKQMELYLKNAHVKYIQGLSFQTIPVPSKNKYKRKFHYFFQQNKLGQFYLVRNCFFEPTILPHINWMDDLLQRISLSFFYNKPAIIGMHRLNFIGYHYPGNRDNNLRLLRKILTEILKRWPDVEFMSSDQLGDYLSNENQLQ